MTAVESCPDRADGLPHVWAGSNASGDASNPCRHCGTSGREHFQRATAARVSTMGSLNTRRELTDAQKAKAAEIVAEKKRRDARAVDDGSARPGQAAGAKGRRGA